MHTSPKVGSDALEPGSATRESQLSTSKSTIENAKDAAKIAIDVLSVVAEATESVPYLGAISKALTTFKEVLDEVGVCKEDCRATINDADEFRELILKFEAKWVQLESGGEDELWKALTELGRAVLDCIETLRALKVDSPRWRDRLKLIFKRDEVNASVSRCRDAMRIAEEKFNMTVALDTNHLIREMHQRSQLAIVTPGTASAAESVWRLRAANAIFHGRESEVTAAVDLIVNHAPARIAILGPGGIGKTSIALAVLHDPRVKELFGDRRCFMSCEATSTADAVVRALADALSVIIDKGSSFESACHRLVSQMRGCSGIICLDNLETPLDADKLAIEELLNDIASLPSIALLVTSRDTSIPTIKWTSPPQNIAPFTHEAALLTWDDICHGHDEYALKLVEAVDCMPLAVTLLARLVSVEGNSKNIWYRWETERTSVIRAGDKEHRLYSVDASIKLSLKAIGSQDSIDVLGILCIFPKGLEEYQVSELDERLKGRLSILRAISLLKQLSLVYTRNTESSTSRWTITTIEVLSPIRHHIQEHHVSDELFFMLADITSIGSYYYWSEEDIIPFGWKRPGCRERCFQMILSKKGPMFNIELLSQVIEWAHDREPQIRSRLMRMISPALTLFRRFEQARSFMSIAIELDEKLGDRQALFKDWVEMVDIFNFGYGTGGSQDLDEWQNAIQKAWDLGQNESGVWDKDYEVYHHIAKTQNYINKIRRRSHMPVVHRSGFYSDNDSKVELEPLESRFAYNQLRLVSPPPWDLSLILETIAKLPPRPPPKKPITVEITPLGVTIRNPSPE